MRVSCTAVVTGQHRPGSAAERNCPTHGVKSVRKVAAPVVAQPSMPQCEVIRRPDGSVAREKWRNESGALHRLDGPALIERDANGVVTREEWHLDGDCHRPDGPAVIARDANGVVTLEQWRVDGRTHRVDGPAYIERDPRGVVIREQWCTDGKSHRVDGPAYIERDANGVVTLEQWWMDGWIHRVDGPAVSHYFMDGTVDRESFRLHGRRADAHEVLAEFLGERASGLSESGLRALASSNPYQQWRDITDDQIAMMRVLYPNFADGSSVTVQS